MVVTANPDRYVRKIGSPSALVNALGTARTMPGYNNLRTADFLRRLTMAMGNGHDGELFNWVSEEHLADLLVNSPNNLDWFFLLRDSTYLPTRQTWEFLKSRSWSSQAVTELDRIVDDIHNGGFAPENELHLELEYSRYIRHGPPRGSREGGSKLSFEGFRMFPFVNPGEVIQAYLPELFAQGAAEEAFEVLRFIQQKTETGIPLLVIANLRFGAWFVVGPIEDYLRAKGVTVAQEYLKSLEFDVPNEHQPVPHISRETWKYIAANNPDVVVVDATGMPEKDGLTRFPAAMLGYITAFDAYNVAAGMPAWQPDTNKHHLVQRLSELGHSNSYRLEFWAPDLTERIFIGNRQYDSGFGQTGGERTLTILSSTSPSRYSSVFDDPEARLHGLEPVLTKKGIGWLPVAPDVDSYVAAIQTLMKARISELLVQ